MQKNVRLQKVFSITKIAGAVLLFQAAFTINAGAQTYSSSTTLSGSSFGNITVLSPAVVTIQSSNATCGSITIEPGAKVVIDNSTLKMSSNAKITVKSAATNGAYGAELQVKNSSLTSPTTATNSR